MADSERFVDRETLLEELAFVARVSSDELLREHLARIQEVVRRCIGLPGGPLVIDGP